MYSAILLAGYNNRRAVEKYSHIVEKDYGEHFIESGYKPLHEFTTKQNGSLVKKPLLQFTLEVLVKNEQINEIIIAGHINQIKNRMFEYFKTVDKPIKFINQKEEISKELITQFSINTKETTKDSVGGNLIKAYSLSQACKEKKHALFVASDSPLTTNEYINHFLDTCQTLQAVSPILLPVVYTKAKKDKLGRYPLLLVNDKNDKIPVKTDKYGRTGFRLSSLMMGNPYNVDVNAINLIYNLRKALNPRTQLRIFKVCREVGFPNIYQRYFIRKNLSIKQCEAICSALFEGKFTAVPMEDMNSTFDFDGTEKEFEEINRMLKEK